MSERDELRQRDDERRALADSLSVSLQLDFWWEKLVQCVRFIHPERWDPTHFGVDVDSDGVLYAEEPGEHDHSDDRWWLSYLSDKLALWFAERRLDATPIMEATEAIGDLFLRSVCECGGIVGFARRENEQEQPVRLCPKCGKREDIDCKALLRLLDKMQIQYRRFHMLVKAHDHGIGEVEKGVSIRDAASFIADGDNVATSDLVSRFSDNRSHNLTLLGKDPSDKRANLYRTSDVLREFKKIQGLDSHEERMLAERLRERERVPVKK